MTQGKSEEDYWYFEVTRDDLLRSIKDPSRVQVSLDTVAPLEVARVLDVGGGIGQALFPLAVSKGAVGVSVDISAAACRIGREFYATNLPDARVVFVRSSAESLPFASESFDVVNCGLALPYTDNARAIAEIARVLRPGGLFLLKIHHTRYYLRQLRAALLSLNIFSAIHAGRVLAAGTIYHLTKRQPRARLLNESFQSKWLLTRELTKHGLEIQREQPNSNALTPSYAICKKQ